MYMNYVQTHVSNHAQCQAVILFYYLISAAVLRHYFLFLKYQIIAATHGASHCKGKSFTFYDTFVLSSLNPRP